MPRIHLRQAIQDESSFRHFVLTNPKHGVVLRLVRWALVDLAKRIGSAIRAHDLAAKQSLLLKTKYLAAEAHDRTYIRQEHALKQALEHFYDAHTVEHLLAAQAHSIQAALRQHKDITRRWLHPSSATFSNWQGLNGNANVSVALSLRSCRFRIFELTSEAQSLYHTGHRNQCWDFKHQADSIRSDLAILADVMNANSTYKLLREYFGQKEISRLLEWARSNTYLGTLERLHKECLIAKFKCPLETRGSRSKLATRTGAHSGKENS